MKFLACVLAMVLIDLNSISLGDAWAQDCPTLSASQKTKLTKEHLFGGAPSSGQIVVRRGYVTVYDVDHRVPLWTAWHLVPEYLDTPKRKGRWAKFRLDPSISNPVRDDDYDGLLEDFDYARGHIAPYFIAGGDRDDDGQDAEIETTRNLPIEDIDDACTVFEINYMSNIAPQLHSTFNGSGGLWYKVETIERKKIAGGGRSLHIIAGTVFGDGEASVVGENDDIFVPPMFFRILIVDSGVVAFLFTHEERIGPKGCALSAALEDCIVEVRDIEAVTGLDFFSDLSNAEEARLEGSDGRAVWASLQ